MNIIFFGSGKFAVSSLRALAVAGYHISCVVTQPDRQKGRGLHLEATAVKTVASEYNLQVYQPEDINTDEVTKFLKSLNSDLFVVVSYGQILSEEVLNIPGIFAINAHASLLPKYRGAAPINWAIIKGEKTTGVSIIKMAKKMDAGPIIVQKSLEIEEADTSLTLENKLSELAWQTVIDSLLSIANNNYKLTPQDENRATLAPKLKKEDGLIDWNKSAQEICNLIRGVINWPGAFTYYKGKLLKIYKARVCLLASLPVSQFAGEIISASKENILVATGKDSLEILELQLEGKRRMKVAEFISGHKILPREILGTKK